MKNKFKFEDSTNHLSQINETESPIDLTSFNKIESHPEIQIEKKEKITSVDIQEKFVFKEESKKSAPLPFKLDFIKNKTSLNNSRKR